MIEGYKVTFTEIYENGLAITIKVPDELHDEFLRKYDPFRPAFYREVTIDQIKEEIVERSKITEEIRKLFKLEKDCTIHIFNDGDPCLLIRSEREKLKNDL